MAVFSTPYLTICAFSVKRQKVRPLSWVEPLWELFPGGRPLKGRRNIVLTKNASYEKDGVEIVHSMEEAIELIRGEKRASCLYNRRRQYI